MPSLNVKVSAKKSPEMTKSISDHLLELTTRILKKKPEVTSIAIDYVDPDDWIIGGKSLSELGKRGLYFDINITDETNTKAEKAEYISAAFDVFSRLLGDLHEVSYIHVQDVRATATATVAGRKNTDTTPQTEQLHQAGSEVSCSC